MNELTRTSSRNVDNGQIKILPKGQEYLVIEKIQNVFRPTLAYRSYSTAEKQGKKMLAESTTSADIANTSTGFDADNVIKHVNSKLKDIETDKLKLLLSDDDVLHGIENLSPSLKTRFIQSINDELELRDDKPKSSFKKYQQDQQDQQEQQAQQDQDNTLDKLKEDKSLFYQNFIPSSSSTFGKQTIIDEITSSVKVDLDTDASSILLTEALGTDSDILLTEALKSFGHKVPANPDDLDEFYMKLKANDWLLASKVSVYEKTKERELSAMSQLNAYAKDASAYTLTERDESSELNDIEAYRDLYHQIKSKFINLELKDIATEELDKSLDEYTNFKESSNLLPDDKDNSLLGLYIKYKELHETTMTPIHEALDTELGQILDFDDDLLEYHEKREIPNGYVLIKREMKPISENVYDKREAHFSFNVITTNEADDAKDLSLTTKFSAKQLEVSDEDVLKAKLTLQQRNKSTDWVFNKNLNIKIANVIETKKFTIFYLKDEYLVLPKGKAEKLDAEKKEKIKDAEAEITATKQKNKQGKNNEKTTTQTTQTTQTQR